MIPRKLHSGDKPGERQVLLHAHLFKNAGTTIDWALKRSFGSGFVDDRDSDMSRDGMKYVKRLVGERADIAAISSHQMPFDPEFRASQLDFWHLVMLRNPIARALSVYQYERTQPAHASPGAAMAKQLSTRDYFGWRMQDDTPAVIRDFHTRSLAYRQRPPRRAMKAGDLDTALRRVQRPRVLIGFVERFDESMLLFEETLIRYFANIDLAHIVQNRSHQQMSDAGAFLRDELGDEGYARFCDRNSLDTRLYEVLLTKFDERISDEPGFTERLMVFKSRCTKLYE